MQLTEKESSDYTKVHVFVEKSAKTWFMDSKNIWNSTVTSNGLDVNNQAESEIQSKLELRNFLFRDSFHRNWIVDVWFPKNSHQFAEI